MGYLVAAELMPNLLFSLHAGALVGGALGTWIGLRETLWIATAGALLGVLWLLPSPILGLRELPEQPLAQFGGSAGADPPTR